MHFRSTPATLNTIKPHVIITGGEAKTHIIQNVDCVYLQPMDITGNDNIPCKAFGYAVGESKQTSGCPNKFVKFCNI